MRILVVCGLGLGSSHITAITVEKALKKLGIKGATVELSDLASARSSPCDLWVASTEFAHQLRREMPESSHCRVIGIKSAIDVDEVASAIRKAIDAIDTQT